MAGYSSYRSDPRRFFFCDPCNAYGTKPRFLQMSNDGFLPKAFSDLHPKFRTPYKSNLILFIFVGAFAAFVPGSIAGDLTSIGTLFAFVLVSLGVWILRRSDPKIVRPFQNSIGANCAISGDAYLYGNDHWSAWPNTSQRSGLDGSRTSDLFCL